jgi:hypothetical protein
MQVYFRNVPLGGVNGSGQPARMARMQLFNFQLKEIS